MQVCEFLEFVQILIKKKKDKSAISSGNKNAAAIFD